MKNYDNIVISCDKQLFKVLSPDSPKNVQVRAARRVENKITMENMLTDQQERKGKQLI